jgi:hypothetical protein
MSEKNLAQALLNVLTPEQKTALLAELQAPEQTQAQTQAKLDLDDAVKTCSMCSLDLPTTVFHANAAADDGLDSRCARCCKVYRLERDIAQLRDQARPMRDETIALNKLDGFEVVKQFTVKRRG